MRILYVDVDTLGPFGERHSAWHWYADYNEVYNPGQGDMEIAGDVTPIALDWLRRSARSDNWFLHRDGQPFTEAFREGREQGQGSDYPTALELTTLKTHNDTVS